MNRRSYLTALTTGVLGAGCSAPGADVRSFSVTSASVVPGGRAEISIEATDVASMRVSAFRRLTDSPRDGRLPVVMYESAEFAPPPDVTYTSHPPSWVWTTARDVQVELPLRTFPDTASGDYPLSVLVQKADADGPLRKQTVLRVRE